ncbi:DnaB-like helicase C-terminal domain-containing protein [Paenibacillus melissococcoides]|uniref:DnaB-like helicase C-terminal domain-containing protein n=1 Tax=Paenibacillus melissococcoides TaxID=2912268 RepID=UPI0021C27878|nr:DnaB-like helicase C-terminal domain-containing protein [Paenibacillus melissococcoides]CAH8718434.1 DnaB-like helicase C-terminal domain-containing protein [Paenibacillus melissococcoides]
MTRSGFRRRELSEEEWERGAQAVTHIAELQLYIDDAVTTTNEIRSFARRLKREYGLAMIVIDYLQLIADKPERGQNSQNDIVSAISRRLKQLTKELGCPFVVLSQLNRSTEKRGDHRPMLSDLRDSGSLEQDADQVWFIHRPDYYNPRDKPGTAELIIAKNRNGPVGTVELAFVRQYAKFGNLAQPEGG